MVGIETKLERILTRIQFIEDASTSFCDNVIRLNNAVAAVEQQSAEVVRSKLALFALETKIFQCYELLIRWFLDMQMNIWLGAMAERILTADVRGQIERQVGHQLNAQVINAIYTLLPFAAPDVAGRAPTNSIVLKAVLTLSPPRSIVKIVIPLYVTGKGAGGIQISTAALPSVEIDIGVGRKLIQDARIQLRATVDDVIRDPIIVPFQNPFDPGRPIVFANVYVQQDQVCLFPDLGTKKYSHPNIPYITFRFATYSYSLELFRRYIGPIFDSLLTHFDKSKVALPPGYQLDELSIKKLTDYIFVDYVSVQVRVSGTISSDFCKHEFSGDYVFAVSGRSEAGNLEIFLKQLLLSNGSLKSRSRGDLPNPICNIEHSAIVGFLKKLPDLVIVKTHINARRADLAIYPPFDRGQDLSIRLYD